MTAVSAVAPQSNARGLAAELRARTQAVHDDAEQAPFVAALMSGRLPIAAYAALVAQNHAIYVELEAAAHRWVDDPVAGPFAHLSGDELRRVPPLEHDLADLFGPDWRQAATDARTVATERYVEHLRAVVGDWPAGFIAHHYVRYLGDLSGGQIIRQRVAQIYGEAGRSASTFYVFDRIEKVKPFRDSYRRLLDTTPLGVREQRRAALEAVRAFELNRDIFLDLGAEYGGERFD